MTEHHWLTCENPYIMVALVDNWVTSEMLLDYLRACGPLGPPVEEHLEDALRADIIRCIVGNPYHPIITYPERPTPKGSKWYNKRLDESREYLYFDISILDWNSGAIPNMIESMLYEEIKETTEARGKSAKKFGRVLRDLPRWENMPVIADALEEAGCDCLPLLEHLRMGHPGGEKCPWCKGKKGHTVDSGGVTPWGASIDLWHPCEECNGTGLRPGRHWVGCHALRVLSGIQKL